MPEAYWGVQQHISYKAVNMIDSALNVLRYPGRALESFSATSFSSCAEFLHVIVALDLLFEDMTNDNVRYGEYSLRGKSLHYT